jgi:hypothetical protein
MKSIDSCWAKLTVLDQVRHAIEGGEKHLERGGGPNLTPGVWQNRLR